MLEGVDEAGDVVEVGQGRLAVLAGAGIDDVHRGPRGAEVHLVPGELQIVARVLPVKHDVAGGVRHRVLDQCTREEESTFGAELPPGRGDRFDAARNGLGQTDVFQHVEHGGVDPLHAALVEGPEPAADHAGAHRLLFLAKRSGRSLCRAALPPMRRLLTAASLMVPPAVVRHGIVQVVGRVQYCHRTVEQMSRFRREFLANSMSTNCFCGWVLPNRPATSRCRPVREGIPGPSRRGRLRSSAIRGERSRRRPNNRSGTPPPAGGGSGGACPRCTAGSRLRRLLRGWTSQSVVGA